MYWWVPFLYWKHLAATFQKDKTKLKLHHSSNDKYLLYQYLYNRVKKCFVSKPNHSGTFWSHLNQQLNSTHTSNNAPTLIEISNLLKRLKPKTEWMHSLAMTSTSQPLPGQDKSIRCCPTSSSGHEFRLAIKSQDTLGFNLALHSALW